MNYTLKIFIMLLAIVMISGCQTTSKQQNYIVSENKNYICSIATKNSGKDWSFKSNYIYELKERGLTLKDCSQIFSKESNSKYSKFNDSRICLNAMSSDKKSWSSNSFYIGYVKEAKFRGLDCGSKSFAKKDIVSKSQNAKKYDHKNIINQMILLASTESSLPPCIGRETNNCVKNFSLPNGDAFIGEYQNGLRNGMGTKFYVSGNIYKGEYKDDIQSGGKVIFPDGSLITGKWKDGQLYYGKLKFANGDIYIGEYKDGLRNGNGKYIYHDGEIKEGKWKNGRFKNIKEVLDSRNIIVSSNVEAILDIPITSSKIKKQSNINKYVKKSNTTKDSKVSNKKLEPNNCNLLQSKILKHIDNDEYDKASSARKLMKEMNCSTSSLSSSSSNSNSSNTKTYVPTKKVSKYASSELNCSVGPLGKFLFREYGKYYAKAFDNNPPKSCNVTFNYCKSRARAIANGAQIPTSENPNKNYSADCRLSGTNRYNLSADCSITPDNQGGGFAAGVANELGKSIDKASAKKKIYISKFEICMSEMGYSLTEK